MGGWLPPVPILDTAASPVLRGMPLITSAINSSFPPAPVHIRARARAAPTGQGTAVPPAPPSLRSGSAGEFGVDPNRWPARRCGHVDPGRFIPDRLAAFGVGSVAPDAALTIRGGLWTQPTDVPRPSAEPERQALQLDVAAFIKGGGEVQRVARGVSGEVDCPWKYNQTLSSSATPETPKVKRGRGRPRKRSETHGRSGAAREFAAAQGCPLATPEASPGYR